MHLTHIFSVACVVGSCHRVSYGNGVPPPKTEGERRSDTFLNNVTTAIMYCFHDIARYWPYILNFAYTLCIYQHSAGVSLDFVTLDGLKN